MTMRPYAEPLARLLRAVGWQAVTFASAEAFLLAGLQMALR